MFNFCKTPISKCTKELSLCAKGDIKADLVIKNGNLINVFTHEIEYGVDVAIICGRVCLVGDATNSIGEKTVLVDASNKFISPGFLDGHIHIESSMLKPSEYAKATIPNGTTGIFYDPHEICNVLGLEGVDLMAKDAKSTPLKAMLTVPSCVPAVNGFEDNNGLVTSSDIHEWMKRDDVIGLGEMMNMPGVINGDLEVHKILSETMQANKIITGHYSMLENGNGLNSYIASNIRCDHESTRAIDAITKMRRGMYVQFREGSAWKDLEALAPVITNEKIDTRLACLVTDDCHPDTLVSKGHLNYIIKKAIKLGIDPITAIQMVTINTAQCFKLDDEIGSIAPGKCADIVIFDNFENFNIDKVLIDGDIVYENSKLIDFKGIEFPEFSTNTMHTSLKTLDDFKVKGSTNLCNVIEIIPTSSITKHIKCNVKIEDGLFVSDVENDILKVAVFERHNNTNLKAIGFVKGFKLKKGALAQTIAHDAHNLIVIGTNDYDMMIATNEIIKSGGGIVSACDGKMLEIVELPIAGLMSNKDAHTVANEISKLEKSWNALGCEIESPFMTMALLSLACIPSLRLTNRGLVDCESFKFIDLIDK